MSSFLWEDSSPPVSATRQSHQSLPSLQDLAQGVPASGRPDDGPVFPRNDLVRDSGNWSMPSQSKHSSTASFATMGIQLPALNGTRASPRDRLSVVSSDRSSHTSTQYGGFGTTVEEPPPPPTARLSHINQPFEPPLHPLTQTHSNSTRESAEVSSPPIVRPNSVNSRMHHLALASPQASANASQTSLVAGLQRERGILHDSVNGNHVPRNITSSGPAPPTPLSDSSSARPATTTSLGRRVTGRTAPPINSNPNEQTQWPNAHSEAPTKGLPWAFPDPDHDPNPNALKPTKGLPWAFPDPELAARPSSKSDHDHNSQAPSSLRRNSIGAASVASSIYTTDSHMPNGHRRMDEDMATRRDDGSRPISLTHDPSESDLSGIHHHHHHHHHHQLQHRQLSTLTSEPTSPAGATPYSRTPELRVSHKLAERKRRSEMKNLFEELRMILPPDGRVSKSSKWEILTKAIDYTKCLEQSRRTCERKMEAYRAEAEQCSTLRREIQELQEEVSRLRQHVPPNVAMSIPSVSLPYHPTAPLPPPSPTGRGPMSLGPTTAMQGIQFSA
ncbi:MAG: hypothetical protein M1823_003805 [Watsoniomyces obsoletus]|nr:MAG: hypothetical protein M1823_003805 [Watsoniomyces obsoletus]